jgi:hypothetical protein
MILYETNDGAKGKEIGCKVNSVSRFIVSDQDKFINPNAIQSK